MLARFLASRKMHCSLQDGFQALSLVGSSPFLTTARLAVLRAAALLTAWLRGNSTGGLAIRIVCSCRRYLGTGGGVVDKIYGWGAG